MKNKFIYIIIPVVILISCSGNSKKNELKNKKPEVTLQTLAAYKSAEHIYENECKLIFRKIDDLQYILFYTGISELNTFKDRLILLSENSFIANPDYINLRFSINYTEETSPDPVTGEKTIIYRLKKIERTPSDRFTAAGFGDDTAADDFIINLKDYVKNDSMDEISKMISYPIIVNNKKNKMRIATPESFVKNYNTIFNKKVKNSIISQPLADVTANSKGLKIGAGEIWINHLDGKITISAINN